MWFAYYLPGFHKEKIASELNITLADTNWITHCPEGPLKPQVHCMSIDFCNLTNGQFVNSNHKWTISSTVCPALWPPTFNSFIVSVDILYTHDPKYLKMWYRISAYLMCKTTFVLTLSQWFPPVFKPREIQKFTQSNDVSFGHLLQQLPGRTLKETYCALFCSLPKSAEYTVCSWPSERSAPTGAPISHRKLCSLNASSVVPPPILWLHDIPSCHIFARFMAIFKVVMKLTGS